MKRLMLVAALCGLFAHGTLAGGPRDADPYIGLYEGTYEQGDNIVKAEARVTATGTDFPYHARVFVAPRGH